MPDDDTEAILAHEHQERAARSAAMVRGRHCTEWVSTLDDLRSAGRDDEALPLLLECITATEREAAVQGWPPAPAYTERAAVIYRRRGDRESEIAILRRYVDASSGQVAGSGSERIAERLSKLLGE